MSAILLTGGTGYLGRKLIAGLLNDGHHLIILTRKTSNIDFLKERHQQLKIFTIGDTPLEDVFSKYRIEIVLHVAANYGRKDQNLRSIIDSNLSFPLEILDLAIKNEVKYFINTDTSLPKYLNSYSRSKKQFLEWLEVCSSSINVLNLQLEYFYGPNDDDSKFITYVLNELRSNISHINFTEATPFRDFIYIDDVVDAYLLLISNIQEVKGLLTVGIGSGIAVMLKDLIEEMKQLVGRSDIKLNFGALPMRENEIMHSRADIGILKSFGWKPKYTFKEGIIKTLSIENK